MRFDISGHYLLLQAFDLTGRKVFGDEWRGEEAFARDTEDPSSVSGERQNISGPDQDIGRIIGAAQCYSRV